MKVGKKLVAAAVATGAVVGLAKVLSDTIEKIEDDVKTERKQAIKKDADDNIKRQYVVDVMTISELKKILAQYKEKTDKPLKLMVSAITPETQKMFPGVELDAEHYIALLLYDSQSDSLIDRQLVNYGEMSDKFKTLMDEHNGVFLVEE